MDVKCSIIQVHFCSFSDPSAPYSQLSFPPCCHFPVDSSVTPIISPVSLQSLSLIDTIR